MYPRPSEEKFIYRNSNYPIYFYKPTEAALRHFHLQLPRLVRCYYKQIRENKPINHNSIIGCGITVGELAMLLIRSKKYQKKPRQ